MAQYAPAVTSTFAGKNTVPDDLLLFFQRKKWTDTLASSGRTIWDELVHRYTAGADAVQTMRDQWAGLRGFIDGKRFNDVTQFLQIQHAEARWWRDACLSYFMSVNHLALPTGYAPPAYDLATYKGLRTTCPADATKPRCPSPATTH